jgi:hypothetical protein
MYAQLFDIESAMAPHKDEYVDWGISINIGASCDFTFGSEKIVLNSGDVLIADFSKVYHSVDRIHESSIPGWFDDENIRTFGRARCSIQIRDIKRTPDALMTNEEFKAMLTNTNI